MPMRDHASWPREPPANASCAILMPMKRDDAFFCGPKVAGPLLTRSDDNDDDDDDLRRPW